MIAALRYEWVRITTVRSTWIALALTLIGVGGLAYLASAPFYANVDMNGNPIGEPTILWWDAFSQPLTLTAVLVSIVAAQSLGQEYRFGLIRLTLTAFPQRAQVLAAKAIAVVAVALVFCAVSYAASWTAVALHGFPSPPAGQAAPDSTFLVRGAAWLVLWALSAWALAGVTRQTALGIAVPIVSGLIVEQILGAVLADRVPWLINVLPWSSGARWSQVLPPAPTEGIDLTQYPPVGWAALGIFGCWVLALVVLEVVAFLRRDA